MTQKNPTKPTRDEILDRRVQTAWEYRQRNREAVNEKARIRMRQSVEVDAALFITDAHLSGGGNS
jgi:hypothetical protein